MAEKTEYIAHLYVYNSGRDIWEIVKGVYSWEKIIEIINQCVKYPDSIRVIKIYQL